jgi:hypothetical protein
MKHLAIAKGNVVTAIKNLNASLNMHINVLKVMAKDLFISVLINA